MAAPAVKVVGLKEFRKGLKVAGDGRQWGKELGREHRVLAREVAGWSQSAATGMGGPFAHFAGQIRGMGTQASARIQVGAKANATFWGAKKRTGWNAGHQGKPQHPEWVGAGWEVGGPGGPYAINPAIAARTNDIIDRYADAVERVSKQAFPN